MESWRTSASRTSNSLSSGSEITYTVLEETVEGMDTLYLPLAVLTDEQSHSHGTRCFHYASPHDGTPILFSSHCAKSCTHPITKSNQAGSDIQSFSDVDGRQGSRGAVQCEHDRFDAGKRRHRLQ
jgi:hypothetical protein